MKKTIIFPTEAPITDPTLATFQKVGTISRLASEKEHVKVDEDDQFKMDGKDELKRYEDKGEMDMWSENQSTLPSKVDKMKGLTIVNMGLRDESARLATVKVHFLGDY